MKQFSVIFSPLAIEDTEEAVLYYERIQPALGKRFAAQLHVTLSSIRRNPFFASVRYDNIRCGQVKKFPFLVHYHVDEKNNIVIIIAVYSTHKEPLG